MRSSGSGVGISLPLMALCLPASASAMCMAPGSFVTPSEGALPPNPSLWVFTADRLPRVGSETAMVVGAPETFGDITVQRLDFTIAEGTLTVEVGRTTHEYVIDPAWDRGEAGPAVNAWTTVESYWSCSFTDADVLEVESRAPVFELSWDGGRAVLPTVPGRFFRATDEPRELRVGHVSCLGYTHPTRGTRVDADEVTVTALYPDGSRRSVVAHRPIEPVPPALAPADDPAPRRSGWLALVAVVVVGGAWAARASLRSTR